jgi:hypothetical protein
MIILDSLMRVARGASGNSWYGKSIHLFIMHLKHAHSTAYKHSLMYTLLGKEWTAFFLLVWELWCQLITVYSFVIFGVLLSMLGAGQDVVYSNQGKANHVHSVSLLQTPLLVRWFKVLSLSGSSLHPLRLVPSFVLCGVGDPMWLCWSGIARCVFQPQKMIILSG